MDFLEVIIIAHGTMYGGLKCWSPCIKCASVKLILLITLQLRCSRWLQPLTEWRGTDIAFSPTCVTCDQAIFLFYFIAFLNRLIAGYYLRGFRRLKKSTCGPWIRSTEKPSLFAICVQKCRWWTLYYEASDVTRMLLRPRSHVSRYLWKHIFFQSFASLWSHVLAKNVYIFPTDKSALLLSVVRYFYSVFQKGCIHT